MVIIIVEPIIIFGSSLSRIPTEFDICTSKVIAIRYQKAFHQEVSSGVECGILLDRTSFYAESGGQAYDEGFITKIGDEVR